MSAVYLCSINLEMCFNQFGTLLLLLDAALLVTL